MTHLQGKRSGQTVLGVQGTESPEIRRGGFQEAAAPSRESPELARPPLTNFSERTREKQQRLLTDVCGIIRTQGTVGADSVPQPA